MTSLILIIERHFVSLTLINMSIDTFICHIDFSCFTPRKGLFNILPIKIFVSLLIILHVIISRFALINFNFHKKIPLQLYVIAFFKMNYTYNCHIIQNIYLLITTFLLYYKKISIIIVRI